MSEPLLKDNMPPVQKEIVIFDSEIVPSHYLFKAKRLTDGKIVSLWGGQEAHMERLGALLRNPGLVWVGFNSNSFDIPLAIAAAGGRSVAELKAMATDIIDNRKPAWMTMRDYGIEYPEGLNTIDLIEVAPGVMVSLKMYGARMNSPSLIDMPFHHDDWLTAEDAKVLDLYCGNDLEETERLYNKVKGQLELREKMSERYSINLMSKSDAQMAETIIAKELGLLRAGKSDIPKTVKYAVPSFVQPRNPVLQDILQRCVRHTFNIKQSNGAVELPEFLEKEPVLLGNGVFQMGIGGLHSKHDKCVHYVATPTFQIVDADVGSFYPNILLNAGYVPRGLGARFVEIYRRFVNERLDAKAEVQRLEAIKTRTFDQELELAAAKIMADGGKIMVNGTFGKLGSCFSKIYAPDLMLGITLTGQFYLLSVIDELVTLGVTIISANTDGITFGGTPELVAMAKVMIEIYGWVSNFEFEFTEYKSISMKDCNNYIAVKTDGKIKAKGLYAPAGLMKNPTNEVCSLAAQAYLSCGRSIKSFILEHFTLEHFPDFLQARTVNGGAVWFDATQEVEDDQGKARIVGVGPHHLGRVARWYYSTDPERQYGIRYVKGNNLVPKSTGGRECMALPKTLPADVDIQRYINEAIEHLHNMGVNDAN